MTIVQILLIRHYEYNNKDEDDSPNTLNDKTLWI